MGKFFDHATAQCTLKAAWGRIPRTAPTPRPKKRVRRLPTSTRTLNIRRIPAKLRRGEFQFDPQQGVLKQKAGGNGKRGIVMASVQNGIVERALLDSLQAKSHFIQQVLEVPTSVGGVPHRSVPHGLRVIEEAFKEGKLWFARSDTSGFFDGIPRDAVLAEIAKHVDDAAFLDLLARATTVVLARTRTW